MQRYIARYAGADQWRIVARIFVNVDYLTRRSRSEGLVRDGNVIRQFALGFTQSQPSFEMVDAGRGKDSMNYKIKGQHTEAYISRFPVVLMHHLHRSLCISLQQSAMHSRVSWVLPRFELRLDVRSLQHQ